MLQVGHDVGRVHNNDIIVDQRRHFDAAIHLFKGSVIGLQQAIHDLIVDALEVEDHSHLAGEGTERTIVELRSWALILQEQFANDSMASERSQDGASHARVASGRRIPQSNRVSACWPGSPPNRVPPIAPPN